MGGVTKPDFFIPYFYILQNDEIWNLKYEKQPEIASKIPFSAFYCHFLIWGHKGNIGGSTVLPYGGQPSPNGDDQEIWRKIKDIYLLRLCWWRKILSEKLLAAFIDLFWICIIDIKEEFWYLWFDILKKCFAIVLEGKGAIKERLLIKVISTICCLIDGSCVWIIKVDYPRPWSFWHSWSQINYNCPPGHPQYKYASLEVASNWARMGHTHWLTSITNKMYVLGDKNFKLLLLSSPVLVKY